MAKWHGYVGIENLGLNVLQRKTLVGALKQLGPETSEQPAKLNHWRIRLDDQAVFFEAEFDENKLTINALKQYLANTLGIVPGEISHVLNSSQFGPVLTLSRNGDKLRVILFGGVGATWNDSRINVLSYLAANLNEWESQM